MREDMQEHETLLNDLTFLALDHGMDSIEDDAGPLIPFVMTESNSGEKNLQRFVTEQIEDGIEAAKQFVDGHCETIIRYAIAWDGFVTLDGKKWDAILVESGDKYQQSGYLMLQRYERKGFIKKKNVPVGNPALMEQPESRLWQVNKNGDQNLVP